MISSITGELVGVENLAAQVRPQGSALTYEVQLPAYLAARLVSSVGRELTLRTLHYLEGQGQGSSYIPRLVGFETAREREFFDLLTSVSGIGNRKALRMMAMEPGRIARLVASRDVKGLKQLPEVGPKLAEMIIAQLHEKMTPFLAAHEGAAAEVKPGARGVAPTAISEPGRQAVAVLVTLGETTSDAERLVETVLASGTFATAEDLISAVYAARAGR
jgi:Holliday junction DNA helicase RuvA